MARQKSRRRGKGEGSIYFDKKNDRWGASFYTEDGKRRYVYGKTQEEAREKLRAAQHEDKQGTLATGPQQTVKQFMEYWLEEVHKLAIRVSSYINYRGLLHNHISPVLGHIRLQKLTIQHVESFYAGLTKKGLSARTIQGIHVVLRKALAHAVYLSLVSRNVCDIAKKSLPRQNRYEYHTLTSEQAQQLVAQVQGHRLEALIILAITTGMRRGELVALRWLDVHFDESYLQIRRSARRTMKANGGLLITEPKTAASRRKIVLSSFLIEVLTRHRANQDKERQKADALWTEQGLVFCNRRGGLINPDDLTKWFKGQIEDAGLQPMRFHDLRHSAATLLLAMGVHVKVVQELLGHSNIVTTLNIYSHVLPSLQQDAMNKLSDLFDQNSGGDEQAE
jgi:integrase